MCMKLRDAADGILNAGKGRMRAAQARWPRLSSVDLAAIRNRQDLIMSVEESYGLSHAFAVQEVEDWDTSIHGTSQTGPAGQRVTV